MLRNLVTRVALVLAVAVTAPSAARAADQTILGNQLLVRNPSTPDKREVIAKAREAGSPDTIVGDPTVAGASLAITANGGTPSAQTFALPAGTSALTGKPFWSGDAVKGFKYKDSKGENGPVKVAELKKSRGGVFQIKAVAVGKLGAIAVVPPNPGTDGCVRLEVGGDGDTYQIRFGADGQVTNVGATQFRVAHSTIEGLCEPSPTTTTTTTTTAPTTTTTQPRITTTTTTAPTTTTTQPRITTTTTTAPTTTTTQPRTTTTTTTAPTTTTTQPACTFVLTWGSFGSGNGQFESPVGVATDGSGNVYVADTGNNRIEKFDASGTFLTTWGDVGSDNGQFLSPAGVATDGSGNVYVADTGNHRIEKFDASGTFLTTWEDVASNNGQVLSPAGVATDGSGNVYVADTSHFQNDGFRGIQKFDPSGTFLWDYPIHPEALATDGSGNLYVIAKVGTIGPTLFLIVKFDPSGAPVLAWYLPDGPFLREGPDLGVATDGSGNVYVAETWKQRIEKFDALGTSLGTWGDAGSGDGQFRGPAGVATGRRRHGSNVYVADTGNNRIQKFACP